MVAVRRRYVARIASLVGLVLLAVVAATVSTAALTAPVPAAVGPTQWPTMTPMAAPPMAVFLGGSSTVGVGASQPGRRWTTLVAAAEGWQENNLGRGGTGYLTTAGLKGCGLTVCPNMQQMVDEVVTIDPAVVVVSGGRADQSQDPVQERAAVRAVLSGLHKGLPRARIIAVGPVAVGTPGKAILAIDAEVRAAAATVGAAYVGLLAPPVLTPAMSPGGEVGITDTGYAAIAARVTAVLNKSK